MVPAVIATWKAMLSSHEPHRLDALIDDSAVFESPVVHTPQVGKAKTVLYLTAADSVLNNGTFRYIGEWYAGRSAVLEFNADIDGVLIDGIDMIWWNDADRIVRFKVMVRPLKAIELLHGRMRQTLETMLAARG
jgi:hypothetical protein